jgi:peptide-methionine (S)-S-oxide reductase
MLFRKDKVSMPTAATALKGRPTPIPTAEEHDIFSRPLKGPYPAGLETAMFGIGCF